MTGWGAGLAERYVESLRANGQEVPRNRGHDLKARMFDCALINFAMTELESMGTHFQSVRCSFIEGAPVYSDGDGACSAIHRDSHIQLAVRDPRCIIGTFRPTRGTAL
jgi:hypothetical protein